MLLKVKDVGKMSTRRGIYKFRRRRRVCEGLRPATRARGMSTLMTAEAGISCRRKRCIVPIIFRMFTSTAGSSHLGIACDLVRGTLGRAGRSFRKLATSCGRAKTDDHFRRVGGPLGVTFHLTGVSPSKGPAGNIMFCSRTRGNFNGKKKCSRTVRGCT